MYIVITTDTLSVLKEGITMYKGEPGHMDSIQDTSETTAQASCVEEKPNLQG